MANYSAAKIPLDTMWSDIDYMDSYKDFTWNPTNYPQSAVAEFVAVRVDRFLRTLFPFFLVLSW